MLAFCWSSKRALIVEFVETPFVLSMKQVVVCAATPEYPSAGTAAGVELLAVLFRKLFALEK